MSAAFSTSENKLCRISGAWEKFLFASRLQVRMTSSIDCTAACFSVNLRQAVPHAELLVLGELLLNQNQFCAGTNVSALCIIPGHRDLPFSCFLLCSSLKHLFAYNSILETYMVSFLAMTSVRRVFRFSSMQPCSQTVL